MPQWVLDVIKLWPLAIVLVNAFFAWVAWTMRQEFVRRRDCEACREKIGKRLNVVEVSCGASPTHNDLGAVYDRINEVSDQVAGLTGQMAGVSRNLDLIYQHLLSLGAGGIK